jgi:hypothetical protein
MLEVVGLLAIIFLIIVMFYMHRQPDLTILQLEQDQVDSQFSGLLEERQPIVIRGVQAPKGLTNESLLKSTRLDSLPIQAALQGTPLTHSEREELAERLSMTVWANHTWLPMFHEYSWIAPFVGSIKTEALIGGLGMNRTTALYTCLLPTEGSYLVSLLSKNSEAFLPSAWEHRIPSTLTSDDTPLVADLKFLDIILSKGNALCLPAHIIYSMEPMAGTPCNAAIVEYHEPISVLAKSLSH